MFHAPLNYDKVDLAASLRDGQTLHGVDDRGCCSEAHCARALGSPELSGHQGYILEHPLIEEVPELLEDTVPTSVPTTAPMQDGPLCKMLNLYNSLGEVDFQQQHVLGLAVGQILHRINTTPNQARASSSAAAAAAAAASGLVRPPWQRWQAAVWETSPLAGSAQRHGAHGGGGHIAQHRGGNRPSNKVDRENARGRHASFLSAGPSNSPVGPSPGTCSSSCARRSCPSTTCMSFSR